MFLSSQKGISLYITLILTSIILAIALGMSLLLVGQLKMTKEIGNSTKAFYAADAGMEQALNLDIASLANIDESNIFDTDYGYIVEITCCEEGVNQCKLSAASTPCPAALLPASNECSNAGAQYFCYKSKGTYKDISRAIEIKR